MSESETKETTISRTETSEDHDNLNEGQGYTLATGAPKPPSRADLEALLLFVEIEDACKIKWDWGRQKHRGADEQEFQGNPLVELHSEGIDALNYLQVLMSLDKYDHECLEKMREGALSIVRGTRLLAKNGAEG